MRNVGRINTNDIISSIRPRSDDLSLIATATEQGGPLVKLWVIASAKGGRVDTVADNDEVLS